MKLEDIYFSEMQFSEFVNDTDASKKCTEIAENFAIGFANWFDDLSEEYCSDYTVAELLEIYKKTL